MGDSKKSSISRRSSCYLLNLKQPAQTAKRLKLSFQRTSGTISILKADRMVEASVGFLDVSETGVGVFTTELLNKGAVIELAVTEPMAMKVRGIVAWSAPLSTGVHKGKFKCRSGIQFVFDGEGQQQQVKEFVKRVNADPVEMLKASTVAPPLVDTPPPTVSAAPPAEGATPAAVDPAAAPVVSDPAAAPSPTVEAAPQVAVPEAAPAPVAEGAPAPVAEATATAPEAAATPPADSEPKAA